MKGYIEVKTNLKNTKIIWLLDKIFKYFPAKKVAIFGHFNEEGESLKWEYDTDCKYYKDVTAEHPLIYELRDDLYCLCQMHGERLIASIIGGLNKKTFNDHKGACKRMSQTISDYLEGKAYILADKKWTLKELKEIFDLEVKK